MAQLSGQVQSCRERERERERSNQLLGGPFSVYGYLFIRNGDPFSIVGLKTMCPPGFVSYTVVGILKWRGVRG